MAKDLVVGYVIQTLLGAVSVVWGLFLEPITILTLVDMTWAWAWVR